MLYSVMILSFLVGAGVQRMVTRRELEAERAKMFAELTAREEQLACQVQTLAGLYNARDEPELARRLLEQWKRGAA